MSGEAGEGVLSHAAMALLSIEERDAMFAQARVLKAESHRRWKEAGGWNYPGTAEHQSASRARNLAWDRYAALSAMAYPAGFNELLAGLRDGEPVVGAALDWLEADYFCRHSGYYKERLWRYLLKHDLTADDAARVRRLLVRLVNRGRREEFRVLARVARRVDSPELRELLRDLRVNADSDTMWRIDRLLGACERTTPRSRPRAPR